jgi:hypothetical protein
VFEHNRKISLREVKKFLNQILTSLPSYIPLEGNMLTFSNCCRVFEQLKAINDKKEIPNLSDKLKKK